MLAGNTAISNAIIQYAPSLLVIGNNKSNANKTSQIPLIKTSSLCKGSQGGIRFI